METVENARPDARYRVIDVTPEMATAWLSVRPAEGKERRVSSKAVARWLRLMRLGLFRHNPADPIVVGIDGAVYNGRHRLHAIVEFGSPVRMTVLLHADPDIFDILDQARPRSADQFVAGGEPQLQAAIARLTLWYASAETYLSAGLRTASMHEVAEEVRRLGPLAEEAARDATRVYRRTHITKSVHGAVLAIGRESGHDVDRITEWLDGLAEGVGLEASDPRLHLRERFASNPPRIVRDQWRVIVRAYNAFLHGESLTRLMVPADTSVLRVGETPARMRAGRAGR